nr:copper chaperone PCu(A)C [uncultured Desulfobulbus sp.]
MNKIVLVVMSLVLLACAHTRAMAGDILIHDPWIREAPPRARVCAAYMVFENTGTKMVKLLEVTSPDFGSVEIHKSFRQQGKMHMMAIDSLAVAAGEKVILQPGGFHLMLFDPNKPMVVGTSCMLRFRFADAADVVISVQVQKAH